MFERNGCGPFVHPPGDLLCSGYWVYFDNTFKTTYSQQTAAVGQGGYVLHASLQDALEVLERHEFFSLAPPNRTFSDIPYSVLTVRRCNVVLRLLMYPIVQTTTVGAGKEQVLQIGGDSAVAALFAAFDALVARSSKEKFTDHDLYFNLNVFDPDRFVPPGCGGIPFARGVAGCILSPVPLP
jgi:hypothetical protein